MIRGMPPTQFGASQSIYVTINNKQIASSTLTTNGQLTKAILGIKDLTIMLITTSLFLWMKSNDYYWNFKTYLLKLIKN